MYEELDDESWLTAALEWLAGATELYTCEGDAEFSVPGEAELEDAELEDSERSSETWNIGASVTGPSESEYIDPELLASLESGIGVPPQVFPGQIVAGPGSVDGLQVATEAL